jgi:1,4-alpha-glucan branching enzyme
MTNQPATGQPLNCFFRSNAKPQTKQEPKMKKTKTSSTNHNGKASQVVHVEFNDPKASAVAIAGSFNDWRPEASPLVAVGEGRWLKELALPPGIYEYRLVVDGEWMADPRGHETSPNPFGELNSVLKVNK